MKCLKVFSSVDEAHLASAHLSGSGIQSFLRDANTVSTDWTLTNAVGGVRLEVQDEDLAEAQSILGIESVLPDSQRTGIIEWLFSNRSHIIFAIIGLSLVAIVFGGIAWSSIK